MPHNPGLTSFSLHINNINDWKQQTSPRVTRGGVLSDFRRRLRLQACVSSAPSAFLFTCLHMESTILKKPVGQAYALSHMHSQLLINPHASTGISSNGWHDHPYTTAVFRASNVRKKDNKVDQRLQRIIVCRALFSLRNNNTPNVKDPLLEKVE